MSGAAPSGGPDLRVTWLGHSTVVLDVGTGDAVTGDAVTSDAGTGGAVTGGAVVRVVTDPLLRRNAGVLRRRGARPGRAWEGADAVLVSHLHHDHAELGSLRLLPAAPVLTAPANAHWLRAHGVTRAVGLGPDEWYDVAPRVAVHLTPAVHGHRPMPHRPNAANGHLVRVARGSGPGAGSRSRTVWAVGDTERAHVLDAVPALAGPPDVVLVPVGGWGPRLSGGHMGPVDAARLCADVGARAAVPVHWGTLHAPGGRRLPPGWMDRPGELFARELERLAPQTLAVVLSPGGSVDVGGLLGAADAR